MPLGCMKQKARRTMKRTVAAHKKDRIKWVHVRGWWWVQGCHPAQKPHRAWMHWSKYTAVSYLQNIWQSNVANRFVWNIATFESNLQQIKVSSDWLNEKVPQSFRLSAVEEVKLLFGQQCPKLSIWILIFFSKVSPQQPINCDHKVHICRKCFIVVDFSST